MSLFHQAFDVLAKNNSTQTTISQIPALLLESFVPGYAVVSKLALNSLGIDITNIVTLIFAITLTITASKYLLDHAYVYFNLYWTSSVSIEDPDTHFDFIMEWLTAQKSTESARSLMIKKPSRHRKLQEDDSDIKPLNESNEWINYGRPNSVNYQPGRGVYWFFWGHRLFWMDRQQTTLMSAYSTNSWLSQCDSICIKTTGRSTRPIKELIQAAKAFSHEKNKARTGVMRPGAEDRGTRDWRRVALRVSRPIDTVILDPNRKNDILNDINEYLHPSTAQWYGNRGIPYRRGYLFYGPPGSGKSSFAWAIAGVFGLHIYCLSLADPNMTEDQLGALFADLPPRCVMLLEDIDTAGLDKRDSTEATGLDNKKKGITLSGLLNVIDGVAAHEGHVLVMTTNFLEKLDAALIRPGRIDMVVPFTLATTQQITELFIRMYTLDGNTASAKVRPIVTGSQCTKKDNIEKALPAPNSGSTQKQTVNSAKEATDQAHLPKSFPLSANSQPSKTYPLLCGHLSRYSHDPAFHAEAIEVKQMDNNSISPANNTDPSVNPSRLEADPPTDLESIAQRFASQLPNLTFSPAEIQGFLLTRKNEPLKALAEVAGWRDEALAAKEKKLDEEKQKRGSLSSEKTVVDGDAEAGAKADAQAVAEGKIAEGNAERKGSIIGP